MPTWLGIDVGSTAVKVAVVRSTYRKTALAALVAADVAESGGVAEAIRLAVSAALGGKVSANDGVSTAIEGSRAALRTLTLPSSAHKQLSDVLAFELEAQVPFEITESVFDFRVLQSRGEKSDAIPLLAVVARLDDVRACIDVIKSAIGQEPERIGVGAFPLANLVPLTAVLSEQGPVVMLDLGTKSSDVLVLRAGEAVFGRTLSFGTQGLPATAPRLAREIRTTIAAYRAIGGDPPTRVYLCGGGAFVSSGESYLAGELELPVEVLPTPQIDMTAIDPERARELPRYAKAIGLALDLGGRPLGLNLRKGPLAYERGFAWMREKLPLLAGLGAVILVSFAFTAWAKMYALSKERATVELALATVSKDVLGEETMSASRVQELLSAQVGTIDEDPMPHGDAFDVMVKLSEDIPQSMKHDIEELDVQKSHVILHGIVGTIPDAQSIMASLKGEYCFQDVKITRTNQVVGGERQKYVMEFDLKCPEDIKTPPKKKGESGAASAAPSASGGK
ncbi:MAG: type IV pilus biogenesis protein PilM [Polyangiales bacterium]